MITKQQAYEWAASLCEYAGEDRSFLTQFWQKLIASPPIYREFCYYPEHRDFLCEYKISGVCIVDVLVWQIDHFKEKLDQDPDEKLNKDRMLLLAFDTFLNMEQDPETYLSRIRGETGSEYPGKF